MTRELQARDNARRKTTFLEAFASCGNVTVAARAVSIGRRTHYRWLKEDAAYAVAFTEATNEAADLLAFEARRRAIDGVAVYKYSNDGVPLVHPDGYVQDPETGERKIAKFIPYFERQYSDRLLMLLLKAARPELYCDTHRPAKASKPQPGRRAHAWDVVDD